MHTLPFERYSHPQRAIPYPFMYCCPIVLLLHTVQRDGIPVSSGSLRKVSGGEGEEGTR